MISRSQKNEKSSPPPPPRESLSGGGGGGCQLILDLVGQIPLLMWIKEIDFQGSKIWKMQ